MEIVFDAAIRMTGKTSPPEMRDSAVEWPDSSKSMGSRIFPFSKGFSNPSIWNKLELSSDAGCWKSPASTAEGRCNTARTRNQGVESLGMGQAPKWRVVLAGHLPVRLALPEEA
jgi:hypothetical protein